MPASKLKPTMKGVLGFGLAMYVLIAIVALTLLNFTVRGYSRNITIVSPVPDFLTFFKNNQVSTIDLWLPFLHFVQSPKVPEVTARSALIYDLTTDKVTYSKNPREKLPMASITKIMTAVVALENPKKDDNYLVSKSSLVGEDAMGLTEGETLSLNELLYGLILHSGNDSAEVIANNYTGGREAFIKAMNDKVKSLGLSDTNFTNPTGLEGDGNQYTTAYDLLVITKFAISKFPTFREIVSTFDHNIVQTANHKAYYLENETNLLTSYPGVKGVKTGFTPEAGFCLVTYAEYDGHQIIGVILNSDNRRDEMKQLLDYSFKIQGIIPPPHE